MVRVQGGGKELVWWSPGMHSPSAWLLLQYLASAQWSRMVKAIVQAAGWRERWGRKKGCVHTLPLGFSTQSGLQQTGRFKPNHSLPPSLPFLTALHSLFPSSEPHLPFYSSSSSLATWLRSTFPGLISAQDSQCWPSGQAHWNLQTQALWDQLGGPALPCPSLPSLCRRSRTPLHKIFWKLQMRYLFTCRVILLDLPFITQKRKLQIKIRYTVKYIYNYLQTCTFI